MRYAVLIKDGEVSDYPADLLIDNEIISGFNLEFELEVKKVDLLIGKSLPSFLIKKLRDKGITFFKVNNFNELEGLNLDIKLPKEIKIKRGNGCQTKFKER